MTTAIPVTYSLASTQTLLRDVLSGYDLGEFTDCRLWYTGVNDTFHASTANGERYILRVYRIPWRPLETIHYELEALIHLHQKGVGVAYPLARRDGSYTCAVQAPEGTRQAVLFPFAYGTEPNYDSDTEAKAYRYGQAVARIHQATDDFIPLHTRAPYDLDFLYRRTLEPIQPYLLHRPDDWAFLQDYCKRFCQHLAPLSAMLDWGFTHNDLQGYHCHINEQGEMTFFDFDCCAPGFRAYELAVFRWCSRLSETEAVWWEPYLRGYTETRPLSGADLAAIPWLVAGRYLWHMWLHTTNAADWGHGWLDDAYFDKALNNLRAVEADYQLAE